jgi:NAD(P)-dependent dehydrogenase (short-subunit alcohol dehydrogenase family)
MMVTERSQEVRMGHRTAIITGASQGLGFALARRLARDGWSLVIDSRHDDRLAVAAKEIIVGAADGVAVDAIAGNVSEPLHRHVLAEAARTRGNLELVVNNASSLGASPLPSLTAITPDVLREIYEVNVIAPIALVQEVAVQLHDGAVVVNISSDAAIGGYETWGGYGSSKAALDQVSRILGAEQPGWRVLAFDPGDMRTEMHQAAFPGVDISDRPSPDSAADMLVELITSNRPSGRYTTGELMRA